MSVEQTLKLLFPLELGGIYEADLRHDAKFLNIAKVGIETLLTEMHGDTAYILLLEWESLLGLDVGQEFPLQARRERVVRKIQTRGGLSIPYFTALAKALGYTINILEPKPFMAGLGAAGDELFDAGIMHQWGVEIAPQPIYQFRAGESVAGEYLLWWSSQVILEDVFTQLKPAHTEVYFSYLEE